MDEHLTNIIETAIFDFKKGGEDTANIHAMECFVSQAVTSAGYRLDPYSEGKSKGELIGIIEQGVATLDRARNFLREEHHARIPEVFGITMDRHREMQPACEVCKFLEETSTVKS